MKLPSLVLLLLSASIAQASVPDRVRFCLSTEPPQLDSTRASDGISTFILGHVMEGLTSYGEKSELVPGIAESWKQDGSKVTFNLRKNAKWSDGKPVTAHDFVYSWRTSVDPKTASTYAFIFYAIKNAKDITEKKLPPAELGAKALDDFTLEVNLEKPIPYFPSMTAMTAFLPVREDYRTEKGDKYGAEASTLLYNGPFKMTEWVHGASIKLDRNPSYWDAANVKLAGIDIPYITSDAPASFNFFHDGKLDYADLRVKENLARAEKARYRLHSFPRGTIFFVEYNHRPGRMTGNANFRRAIQLVIDASVVSSKIVGMGSRPPKGLIPSWMRGKKSTYRTEHPAPASQRVDLSQAKKALALAKQELKLESFPPIHLLSTDSQLAKQLGEHIQFLLKSELGLEVRLDQQTFKHSIAKSHAGEFDLLASGWSADYPDPYTFLERFAGWSQYNTGAYQNPAFDRIVKEVQEISDPAQRFAKVAAAEKVLFDEAVVVPLYESGSIYVKSGALDGVRRHPIGMDPDFTRARFSARK